MGRVLPTLVQWLILATVLVAVAAHQALGLLNHDTSFLLLATQRWLDGATLYTDIMEINPPLIFYMTAPAVMFADDLGINASAAFVVSIAALSAISLGWCWSLLRRVPSFDPWKRLGVIAACLAGLMIIPGTSFGQREHVFIAFALPYLTQQIFATSGLRISRAEGFALGAFASLGIALKPFFPIPVLFLTLVRCRIAGNLKPAIEPGNIAIAAGCFAYLLLVMALHPEYFSVVVPLGTTVYSAVGFAPAEVIPDIIVPLLLIVAMVTLEDIPAASRDRFEISAAILAGLLMVYLIQFKGWVYQLLPYQSMAFIVCVLVFITTSQSFRKKPLHFVVIAIVPFLLLTKAVIKNRYDNDYIEPFETKLKEMSTDWRGRSFLLLSTDNFAAFPLINKLGGEWAGRYPYQWVVAGALASQERAACTKTPDACPRLNEILDYGRRTNVDDVVNGSPDVVIVDARPRKRYFPGGDFDYIDFLMKDPRFAAKWHEYRKLANEVNYDIWVREPNRSVGGGSVSASQR